MPRKKLRRITALLTTLVLVLNLAAVTAFASDGAGPTSDPAADNHGQIAPDAPDDPGDIPDDPDDPESAKDPNDIPGGTSDEPSNIPDDPDDPENAKDANDIPDGTSDEPGDANGLSGTSGNIADPGGTPDDPDGGPDDPVCNCQVKCTGDGCPVCENDPAACTGIAKPTVDDLKGLDVSNDPPFLNLAETVYDENGEKLLDENGQAASAKITQHATVDGNPVTSELTLDTETNTIYYEVTATMDNLVAMVLQNRTASRTDFAGFNIQIKMAETLKFANIDDEGFVEFKFTCPFLEPTTGAEVNVDGSPVQNVRIITDQSYIYKVPAGSLTDENGLVLPFTFSVQWKADEKFDFATLKTPMSLATAVMQAASKQPLATTGSVSGYVNPDAIKENHPAYAPFLTNMLLNNSPTIKEYLDQFPDLTDAEKTALVMEYLNTEEGKNAFMGRTAMGANVVKANIPCNVVYTTQDDKPVGVGSEQVAYDSSVAKPDAPEYLDGKDLVGWFIKGTGTPFDFDTDRITDDTVLELRYKEHEHKHGTWTVVKDATCLPGERTTTCPVCGETVKETIPADKPHTWGDWAVTRQPTYEVQGEEKRVCEICGAEETRPLAILDRPVQPPVITDPVPSQPTATPGSKPETVDIEDTKTPLAAMGLNLTDHFAYIIGYQDGTVRPEAHMTRAEAVTVFFRLMNDDYRNSVWSLTNGFSDVDRSSWHNTAISTVANTGALKHFQDTSSMFEPDKPITRAEFAYIAAGFISVELEPDPDVSFNDISGHWAEAEILKAAAAGWTDGYNGNFDPDAKIKRSEVVAIVNRMTQRNPDENHLLDNMTVWTDNRPGAWYYKDIQEAGNSHEYEKDPDANYEIWTKLIENRDWSKLETYAR